MGKRSADPARDPSSGPARDAPTGEQLEADLAIVIAQRVREARQDLGLTVAQLADRSGISKGMLSKIENAQASPSLSTLARLSLAIDIPVTAFFRGLEEEHDALFIRSGDGLEITREGTRAGHRYQLLGSQRGAAKRMEPTLVTLTDESERFPLFQHVGTELIYMLAGAMVYGYGSARYELRRGDALQFDGEVPHGPTKLIRTPLQFLSIIATGRVDA